MIRKRDPRNPRRFLDPRVQEAINHVLRQPRPPKPARREHPADLCQWIAPYPFDNMVKECTHRIAQGARLPYCLKHLQDALEPDSFAAWLKSLENLRRRRA